MDSIYLPGPLVVVKAICLFLAIVVHHGAIQECMATMLQYLEMDNTWRESMVQHSIYPITMVARVHGRVMHEHLLISLCQKQVSIWPDAYTMD